MCTCKQLCRQVYVCIYYVQWNTHILNKPEIPGQTVCYKQEFVIYSISEQFPMRYCSTWLRSLLCHIKKFVIGCSTVRAYICVSLIHQPAWFDIRMYVRTYVHTNFLKSTGPVFALWCGGGAILLPASDTCQSPTLQLEPLATVLTSD